MNLYFIMTFNLKFYFVKKTAIICHLIRFFKFINEVDIYFVMTKLFINFVVGYNNYFHLKSPIISFNLKSTISSKQNTHSNCFIVNLNFALKYFILIYFFAIIITLNYYHYFFN